MALAAAKADSPGAMHTGAADMMSRIVFVAFTSCTGADTLAPAADTGSLSLPAGTGRKRANRDDVTGAFSQMRLGRRMTTGEGSDDQVRACVTAFMRGRQDLRLIVHPCRRPGA
jgi:hypothetical protein